MRPSGRGSARSDAQQCAESNEVLQQEADLSAGHSEPPVSSPSAPKTPTTLSAPSRTSSRLRVKRGDSGPSRWQYSPWLAGLTERSESSELVQTGPGIHQLGDDLGLRCPSDDNLSRAVDCRARWLSTIVVQLGFFIDGEHADSAREYDSSAL